MHSNLSEIFIPAFISFLITVLATPLTIIFAKKYGLMDNPEIRPHPAHLHKKIIPRAGGLACFIGLIVGILFFVSFEKYIIGLILALIILLIVGLADDKLKNLSPYARLVVQFIAALAVVGSGVGINFITNPFGGIISLDSIVIPVNGEHQIILIADFVALVWIVWVMNMINWAKGVDGQMPGVIFVAAIILGLLSIKLYLFGDFNQLNVTKLSFITAGVSLGFFIFNWYPAKIFPGFSGSNILGLMIATLAILSGAKLATAGLVLLIPATDFIYTFFRRILSGKSPVWGDRGHLHHKLLDLGLSHQIITCLYIALGVILGAAALTLDSRGKFFAAALVTLGLFGLILWLNFFGGLSRRQDQDNG